MTAPVPRRRLHPLSPLLRGFRYAVLVVVAISWQGYRNLGAQRWAMVVAAAAVVVLIGSVLSYLFTGYHVVGRELRIQEGLLFRRTRAIPVERLQSVELVQPLMARIFGLADLRLEVVGGARTEAPLAFLSLHEATNLRQYLLDLAAQAKGVPAELEAPPAPQTLVYAVRNRDLLLSQLLRPQWWLLPVAIGLPVYSLLSGGDLGFVAVASTVTAAVGAILVPLRVLFGDWRFTMTTADDGLHIRRGLVETRTSTVPEGRIQSVKLEWPLLWRPAGWIRATMHIAGVRRQEGQPDRSSLLPVGRIGEAEAVVARAVPGAVLTEIAVRPVPRRAGWLVPLRRRVLGYHLGPYTFASRDGLLTRSLVLVPYPRVQSVRVRQGPLQRRLRLATVQVDVAGGGPTAVAAHIDVDEARWLAQELAERTRAARRRPQDPTEPQDPTNRSEFRENSEF